MTTLEAFLRTGVLGPVVLGMPLGELIAQLGEPQDSSRKGNPLQLKYGSARFLLWKAPRTRAPKLREIKIVFQPAYEGLPEPISFADWHLVEPPTELQFTSFINATGYHPVAFAKGSTDRQLIFLSGVSASITAGMLHSIRFVEREARQTKAFPVVDELESSEPQIVAMLNEAEDATKASAYRAALLLSWAALEAAMRRRLRGVSETAKIDRTPALLAHELLAAGVLTKEEHHQVEHLRQLRSAIAHGLQPVPVALTELAELRQFVMRLLQTDQPDITRTSDS